MNIEINEQGVWMQCGIKTPGGCVVWTGNKNNRGYGVVKVGRKKLQAHRFVWEQKHGPIPDGMCVCHKCDNTECVNPDHMFLGSHTQNMQDAAKKGRVYNMATAAALVSNRLTDVQREEIKQKNAAGVGMGVLAREYGISRTSIKRVITGRRYGPVKQVESAHE